MSEISYSVVDSPHQYYPNLTNRKVLRFQMTKGDSVVAFADYFIESGWSHFLVLWFEAEFRSTEIIMGFIRNYYSSHSNTQNSFWWATPDILENYLHVVANEFPDITFAAGGYINKVIHASV